MEAKLTQVNRSDAIDREYFKAMLESEAFRLVQARIADQLKRAEETCVFGDTEIGVHRAQGAVHALRTALRLPQMILDEMNKAK